MELQQGPVLLAVLLNPTEPRADAAAAFHSVLVGRKSAPPQAAGRHHDPVMHNQGMARGWESKSVESQMESAESERESARRRAMSAGELARERERKSLELSRTRVLRELAGARNARHRQMLEAALAHLDGKISGLV